MKRVLLVLSILAMVVPLGAQTTPRNLRAAWEIEGPPGPVGGPRPNFTVAQAQGYTYRIYKVADAASGTALATPVCTTTNDQYVKTCTSPVPTVFDQPGLQVDMTAVIAGIETPHSLPATIPNPLIPQPAPSNFRILQGMWNGLRIAGTAPINATRTMFFGRRSQPGIYRFQVPNS